MKRNLLNTLLIKSEQSMNKKLDDLQKAYLDLQNLFKQHIQNIQKTS